MQTFWMVYMEEEGSPALYKYETLGAAQIEAERSASTKGNLKVWVLQAVGCCQRAMPPIVWHNMGEGNNGNFAGAMLKGGYQDNMGLNPSP